MNTRILLAATFLLLFGTATFAGPIAFTSQAIGGSPLPQTDLALVSDGISTAWPSGDRIRRSAASTQPESEQPESSTASPSLSIPITR